MAELFGKDLFNSEYKKDAQQRLENDVREYNASSQQLNRQLERLQDKRDDLSASLQRTETVIDELKNTPAGFKDKVETLKINLQSYQVLLDAAKKESAKIAKGAGAGAAGGVVAGTAVAAFGGTALTALAMSIGTASTGTAIAGLTGAAATNAALAWLGGGAIAAGGAGIAGGETILSLLGPIGWTIGAATLATTGIMANGKNKKAAAQMLSNDTKVKASIRTTNALVTEVKNQAKMTKSSAVDLEHRVSSAEATWPDDYLKFSETEILDAGTLINNALAAEKILNAKLGKAGKFEKPVDLDKTKFGNSESSNNEIIGEINAINMDLADVITPAGQHYYFNTKVTFGDFKEGDQITFRIDGETAKAVRVVDKGTIQSNKNTMAKETAHSDTKVGQVSGLAGGVGTITTNSGESYSFSSNDAAADIKDGSLVFFKASGQVAREVYNA
jgi:hypothetical protein